MRTDISGMARTVLQERSNMKVKGSVEENELDITVSFMELMNQNRMPSGINVSEQADEMKIIVNTDHSTKTAYDTCAKPAKSVTVKEEVTLEEMQQEVSEILEDYEERIRKILKDELDITDEEISVAMESLGMSFLDFRNLQNLATLVQALTGQNLGILFLSDAFQNVMEQVTLLTEDLCAELGITKEELNALCEVGKQMEQPENEVVETKKAEIADVQTVLVKEDVAGTEVIAETNVAEGSEVFLNSEEIEVAETSGNSETKAETLTEQEKIAIVKPEEEQSVVTEEVKDNDKADKAVANMENLEQNSADMQEEFSSDAKEQSSAEHSQNTKADTTNYNMTVSAQQLAKTEPFAMPQERVQPYTNQVDVADLIGQIARNVRVTISATTNSMEMQLNPENLGKIYLNVSEREGVVRAQITTQTESVKEALETQLVELRQTLNQQGVKVDAIEVTVGTHEFEQNLEGNAKEEEQAQRQMEKSEKQARRNLNLDELDGLTGLMTEEERLAAQIMKDNGNQVDLTA